MPSSSSQNLVKLEDVGAVAQLVRVSPCHGEGRGFESRQPRPCLSAQLSIINILVERFFLHRKLILDST